MARLLLAIGHSRQAVSGVVAASLGVVLISVLLTMVVTFWVPAWGYDNEVAHSRDVLDGFADVKSSVETRAVAGATNQTVTASFPLGVGAVPLFGAETPGRLSYRYIEGETPRFQARLTDEAASVNLSAAGALRYEIVNRYYVPLTYSYEMGAVVLDQPEGSTMRIPAAMSITNSTAGVLVSVTLVTLEGQEESLTGVEPRTVTSRLTVVHAQEYEWPGGTTLFLNVSTWYPAAWQRSFNTTAAAVGLAEGSYSVTLTGSQAPWVVSFAIEGVTQLAATSALVYVQLD
jgi:hypothetical protein